MRKKLIAALALGVFLSVAACSAVRQEPPIADQLASRSDEIAVKAVAVATKAGCTGFTSHLETQDLYVQVGECTLNGSTLHIMFFNSQSDQEMYVLIAKAAGNTLGHGDLWVIDGSDSAAVEQATRAAGGSIGSPAPAPAPGGGGGATALCNDGTYSYAAHHQGACSHHGGVKVFYK